MLFNSHLTAAAAALILAGCATTSGGGQPRSASAAQDPTCIAQAGSRIVATPPSCVTPGRSYSHDDIERTGASTAGGALQLLDPSITVRH